MKTWVILERPRKYCVWAGELAFGSTCLIQYYGFFPTKNLTKMRFCLHRKEYIA
jgi:hypothetical protein